MTETKLSDLPVSHPLRNAPLASIQAQYRWKRGVTWRTVLPSFGIAAVTYNQLGSVWTEFDDWVVDITVNKE